MHETKQHTNCILTGIKDRQDISGSIDNTTVNIDDDAPTEEH